MMEYGFVLKKVISAFCMPLPLAALLLLLASLLLGCGRKTAGRWLMLLTLAFVYLVSIHPTGEWMARNLEQQYPAFLQEERKPVDYVLVLGSAHTSDASQPITSLLSTVGLARLMEGIRVYRLNPGSKLLLSGFQGRDQMSHAKALQSVALYLGVPKQDMILEERVKDTREEAMHWIGLAKNSSLAVVTSAIHMPRSMYLFEQAAKEMGYQPSLYAAPTEYISHADQAYTWENWFPSGKHLYTVERAWHEYLGLMWAKLNSQIN